jgi:hypothetical protein
MEGCTYPSIDFKGVTPRELHSDIEFQLFHEFEQFNHRGHSCSVPKLLSELGALIDQHAAQRGESPGAVALPVKDVVELVVGSLQSKFPAWFGESKSLAVLDAPYSETHLSERRLRHQFLSQSPLADSVIEGDSWAGQQQVVVPLVGLLLTALQGQVNADATAASMTVRRDIRTAIERGRKHGLTDSELAATVQQVLQAEGVASSPPRGGRRE